ncbi:MAG TPA: site-specific integrase [Roseiarcus sp.]|jgi:integrase|nr:site-specific integrase [Roseiarcus sp.]
MKGHLRQRGARSFELKLDVGKNAAGERAIEYRSFKGTRREAQTKLAELIAAVGQGAHVARSALTVGEHVAERIEQWQALGVITAKTAERYRELHANQIAPFIGSIPLQAIKAADVERWHATLRTSGRKDGQGGLSTLTIRHSHRLLSKALKEAQRHDLVVKNAASLQSPPRVSRTEVTILDADQIRGVVRDLKDRSVYPKAVLALFTGMRRGEILALRWQDFDPERKTLTVRAALEETKGGVIIFKTPKSQAGVREITLPDIAVETLGAYRRQQLEQRLALGLGKLTGDALIFARLDNAPQSPHALSAEWSKAATSLGLDGRTFHSLRHTHASQLIAAGIDVVKISKRLGHASPTITLDVYAHLFDKHGDKSAEAINDAVAKLL